MSPVFSSVSIIFIVIIMAVLLTIPVVIGVYVYRDAKSRNMNAPLWTVIAILAPTFIGLIIYLLARNEHEVFSCPQCGGTIQESFAVCPRCGGILKKRCSTCDMLLEEEWKVCPGCGREALYNEKVLRPVTRVSNENNIVKLLAIVIIIPILLCILLILGVLIFRFTV